MRLRGLGPSVCLLVLAFGHADSVAAQIGRTEVAEVRFNGNESFPDDSLALAIITRQTECRSWLFSPFCWQEKDFAVQRFYLRRGQVQRDQLRLQFWYQKRGFQEARVDTATTFAEDGRARVSFDIDEGRPVLARTIRVDGLESTEFDAITADLPLKPGDRLSEIAMDATRDSLTLRLQNRGYAWADVLRHWSFQAAQPYGGDVVFDVAPGPRARYGEISVSGNRSLSAATVRNTLQFQEGDLYSRSQLSAAQGRLFGLDILRSGRVEAVLGEDPDAIVPVRVQVVEGDAYRWRAGGGWNNAECLAVEASWASRNFMGGGRSLQVRGRMSNILTPQFRDILCPSGGTAEFGELTGLASIDFAQPWIFSTRNRFNASLFGERQSLPDVFIREAIGLDVAITRMIGPTTPLTAFYRPELSRLDAADVLFCTGFLVCTPQDIAVLEGANRLAPLGLSFSRNMANNPLNATRGYVTRVDVEHASKWTGSEFRYDRIAGDVSVYDRISTRGILAGRVRAGWVGVGTFDALSGSGTGVEVVHPQKRFYAGGANSVRGFGQSQLGPSVLQVRAVPVLLQRGAVGGGCTPVQIIDLSCNASGLADSEFTLRPTGGTRLVEASVELRFGFASSFEGVTFADVGQLWGAQESVDLADLEVTPGIGVRYLSPIGPIRLDLGYRFRRGDNLSVVTSQIRPFDPLVDLEDDRLIVEGQGTIPYVLTDRLAVLSPTVLYGEFGPWSYRRFQLHISIGQAF